LIVLYTTQIAAPQSFLVVSNPKQLAPPELFRIVPTKTQIRPPEIKCQLLSFVSAVFLAPRPSSSVSAVLRRHILRLPSSSHIVQIPPSCYYPARSHANASQERFSEGAFSLVSFVFQVSYHLISVLVMRCRYNLIRLIAILFLAAFVLQPPSSAKADQPPRV